MIHGRSLTPFPTNRGRHADYPERKADDHHRRASSGSMHAEDYVAAACGGDLLDGRRRSLRTGGNRGPGRLRRRDLDPALDASPLERAYGPYGQRALECPAGIGRILRVGETRPRTILGLSGGVAVVGRQHLRHGDLSDPVYSLPVASLPGAWGGVRSDGRRRPRARYLHRGQRPRGEGRGNLVGRVFAGVTEPICHHDRWCIDSARRSASGREPWRPRSARRHSHRHVELHGLGQRVDARGRSRPTPTHLSAGHDRRGFAWSVSLMSFPSWP